jgi:2-dehydro-3-deoxyphosphooctonate aldolase (KDO 8-P synthase)
MATTTTPGDPAPTSRYADAMKASFTIGSLVVGDGAPLALLAGPCVLESERTNTLIGATLRDACEALGLSFIYKASFDKANRSSGSSPRGPGMEEGLEELLRLRRELDVPVTTDVHLPEQAERVAQVVDLLQVPAFLSRQTDLLQACGRTGVPVNIKKGQFLSPGEMRNPVEKVRQAGSRDVMITERGTFFGYHRLVNDFIGIGDLIDLGVPVCFDATHSTQLPGAEGSASGGRPERAPLLAKAAVAAGVHAVFLECHPEPGKAMSDKSTMLRLDDVPPLLEQLAALRQVVTGTGLPRVQKSL